MLVSLSLENFRGFDQHELPLKNLTVAVGRNNAGKSTIVEALRLVSIVVTRYRHLTYYPPPHWLDIPKRNYGVSPSLKNQEINFKSLFYQYGEPPSLITATFDNGNSVSIYLAGEGVSLRAWK